MTGRPILFSGPMVRALLDGRKTVTRRVVRQLGSRGRLLHFDPVHACATWGDDIPDDPVPIDIWCPFGAEGDRLWVKETWAAEKHYDDLSPKDLTHDIGTHDLEPILWYRADEGTTDGLEKHPAERGRWRPSIFCMQWMSRITLEVVDVRVERLQDITDEDARAEGIGEPDPVHGRWADASKGRDAHWSYRKPFANLWDSINAKRGYSWESNPWTWRIEFALANREGAA